MKPKQKSFVLALEKWGDGHLNRLEDMDFTETKDEWLEKIMEEFGERLTKLAYNYLKDWKFAEDVVQDVFITCYRDYENKNNITSFKAWIFRITINKCKDVLKSSTLKKVIINSDLFRLFTSKDLTPELAMVKRDENEFLAICVMSLPLKYREVITLHYYEELALEEMSKILNLNVNTIKTRLSRGRQKLKDMFERWDGHGE
ncbi:MAG: sigma-70 family RNA polymerase sigma factor [Bacillus sp. (in: Bacteria)]|nr:sigma-70 family RNA polymerase sigma factor [Bacillus sp. (in: firmicutes)]